MLNEQKQNVTKAPGRTVKAVTAELQPSLVRKTAGKREHEQIPSPCLSCREPKNSKVAPPLSRVDHMSLQVVVTS